MVKKFRKLNKKKVGPSCPSCDKIIKAVTYPGTCMFHTKVRGGSPDWKKGRVSRGSEEVYVGREIPLYCGHCGASIDEDLFEC